MSRTARTSFAIVYPFSVAGVDLSQKTVLEVVMLGDNSNNLINFRLGGIDENADGSGILRTEDTAGTAVTVADAPLCPPALLATT